MFDFDEFLAKYKGGISAEEGRALSRYAATAGPGDIVEIGSFRGKSAVALAQGANLNGDAKKRIFCIEPHAEFVGVYGGVFGASDRADFYQIMLESGAYQKIALVNLPSAAAARSWSGPIALLFIDGDHTFDGVRTDVAAWEPFVVSGGIVAFDDALDPQIGPYQVIESLLGSGRFELVEKVGKISFLRKLASAPIQKSETKATGPLRILVVCNDFVVAGGLFRFERAARVLRQLGHELCFATFSSNPRPAWQSECPVMDIAEAVAQTWDATMVPGAGFSEAVIQQFKRLQGANFGYRIQHVLNDQMRRDGFLAVNRQFRPDLVLFNNRHWPMGSFTDFSGRRFGILEGAVDTRHFAPSSCRSLPGTRDTIVLGGLANKNPEPIISSLRLLPNHFRVKLFGNYGGDREAINDLLRAGRLELVGQLDDSTLPSLYESLDIVVHTEHLAGWANLAAEAAASGIPLICTEHGTAAFAVDKETAHVLGQVTAEAVTEAVRAVCSDPDATLAMVRKARERILKYDWTEYSLALADLCRDDGKSHYTWAPQFGLFGKWPLEDRRKDLDYLFANCAGATVIDFGCAEGLLARGLLERGARLVHGFDVDCGRVATAGELCAQWPGLASFRYANLNEWELRKGHYDHLLPTYDIVLYLGIHHHLTPNSRMVVLADALSRTGKMFAIRTTDHMYSTDSIDAFIRERGFSEIALTKAIQPEGMGEVKIYLKD